MSRAMTGGDYEEQNQERQRGGPHTSLACFGECYGVSADTAERVEDGVAPATFGNLVCDELGRDAVPSLFVK